MKRYLQILLALALLLAVFSYFFGFLNTIDFSLTLFRIVVVHLVALVAQSWSAALGGAVGTAASSAAAPYASQAVAVSAVLVGLYYWNKTVQLSQRSDILDTLLPVFGVCVAFATDFTKDSLLQNHLNRAFYTFSSGLLFIIGGLLLRRESTPARVIGAVVALLPTIFLIILLGAEGTLKTLGTSVSEAGPGGLPALAAVLALWALLVGLCIWRPRRPQP